MLGLWLRQKSRPYGILHKLKGKKIINKRPLLIRDSRVSYCDFYREFKITIQLWKSVTVKLGSRKNIVMLFKALKL